MVFMRRRPAGLPSCPGSCGDHTARCRRPIDRLGGEPPLARASAKAVPVCGQDRAQPKTADTDPYLDWTAALVTVPAGLTAAGAPG